MSKDGARRCPHAAACELYPIFTLQASLRTWQIRYCENTYTECERYRLTERGGSPPPELLPSGHLLPTRSRHPKLGT